MRNISFLLVLLLIGCNQSHNKSVVYSNKFSKAVQKFEEHQGVKIHCLSEIGVNTISDSTSVILCFTDTDCSGCVERGFQIIDYLQSKLTDTHFFVITTNSNIKAIQMRYHFKGNIYLDEDSKLIKEFSYLYTPYIIIVNNGIFSNGYFLDNQNEYQDDVLFMDNLFNLN